MAYCFGDGFDLYATGSDIVAGYWDGGTSLGSAILNPGRFSGSQALQTNTGVSCFKSSPANDAVHHLVCAHWQSAALSGSTLGTYLSLGDGATAQCSIVFRSDGAIVLASGGPTGTVLATYTGAVTLINQWFAFEFEVLINNTTGSFKVRTNGATSDSFSATGLNTRGGTANNYANRLTLGWSATVTSQRIDDLLWRSDAASVPWVGDIRCFTRMPTSDASVQFSRAAPTSQNVGGSAGSAGAIAAGTARYGAAFTPTYDCTLSSVALTLTTGFTGNMKCALFASSSGAGPGAVIASATSIANPATGVNIFTFSSPPTVLKGSYYTLGFDADTSSGNWSGTGLTGFSSATAYASFPVSSPTTSGALFNPQMTVTLTPNVNYAEVNETLQDGATTYVYDSTVGHADLYGVAALGVTPPSVVAVTTRGFVQKSDAGSRSGAVQLKSGATTVNSGGAALSTAWSWMWRTDTTDPNTSAAWTASAVDAAQFGPRVMA